MDNNVVISVKNLSKKYRLYDSPKYRLMEALHPFRQKYHHDFWALNDVSFDVQKGETIGVIGRNGSGKSTLLQILCGVMQPTLGEVSVNGRISALLELGAGFSPEFSGRDNVYMNGALVGITRKEMDGRFEEIADFADIGDYIDQPMKTYSSGMFIRLAFSCAVNVDPDILIVDEALAVGDVRFQKKCFDRMNSYKERGKTVILVTHALDQVKRFSSRALLLEGGRALHMGDPGEAVLRYMQMQFPDTTERKEAESAAAEADVISEPAPADGEDAYCLEVVPTEADTDNSFGAGGAWINRIKIYGLERPNIFHGGEDVEIQISFSWDQAVVENIIQEEGLPNNLIVGCGFDNQKSITIFGFNSFDAGELIDPLHNNNGVISFRISLPMLQEGNYFMYPAVAIGTQERHTQLRWYENLIHLRCVPERTKHKYIYGVLKLGYEIKGSKFESLSR